jgi:hypothetical protein
VIAAAEGPRAFQGPEVGEIFDDADRSLVTLRVTAYRTGLNRIEITADRTGADCLRCLGKRSGERLE